MQQLLLPMWSKDANKPSAAKVLGVHRNKIRKIVADGDLPTIMFGGMRVIALVDIEEYINRLRNEQGIAS